MWNENQFNLSQSAAMQEEMARKNWETQGGYQAKTSGNYGEFKLASVLDALPDEFHVINDILLDTTKRKKLRNGQIVKCGQETSTQLDHIIVTPYGIFVVETKNHKGMIFGDMNGTVWTQVLRGRQHYTFYNPLKQNAGHIENLSKQLRIRPDKFQGVIVFTNDEADLRNVQYGCCVRTEQLYDFLMSYTFRVIWSPKQVYEIIHRIDRINKGGYMNVRKHIDFVKKQKERFEYYNARKKGLIK